MNEPMTFLDFFSGVGGFRKGFELCGMVCKGHCEIDKFADRSYRAIHDVKEDEWYGEDITKTEPADLPRVNLWAGGFPCQDISVSGRQRGLAGKRSSLFFEIVRLLKGTPAEDRPEWLVLENVKNLLSVNRGWDFATVLHSLAEIGYHKGHDFKDYICPNSMEKSSDCLKLGGKYCRVLFLKDYASYIKDSMVTELTDFNRNMMLSIDVVPIPTDEAVREVENRLLGIETNITNWQRRQNANNNFSAVVPYDMELQRKESKEFLDDLTTRDQRMMLAVITMVITADDKKQLDSDTETVLAVARKHMCQLAVLKFQQFDGLNTVLPIGTRRINAFRTLTTESLAVFMPFKVQEVQDKGGIYFGENAISHNLIMCNKANLLNQSAFLLGVPGSGKSFSAKELIAFLILDTTDDVLICDPENEFGALAAALGKETTTVIHMAAGGKDRLNAMYMVDGYGENNPIVEKSQFIMSLVEQIDKAGVGPQQKSIIDRCTALVYQDAERTGKPATLYDLRNKLLEQPEEKAKEIALSLELFTTGSLDIFGHESTVDLDKRIVVFDIHGLGEQLKPTGLLVITDTILNRVTLNWKKGKRTHIFIDEFHVVFENEQSGIFFNSAWRQFRKRNGYPTAITQNVEYLLDSVQASTMLSNSEFVVMLNQAFSDRAKLSKLLNISDEQMSYVTNADAGCGLIKYGSALVPFINRFPKDTELYRLMTTRPGEGVFGSGNAS